MNCHKDLLDFSIIFTKSLATYVEIEYEKFLTCPKCILLSVVWSRQLNFKAEKRIIYYLCARSIAKKFCSQDNAENLQKGKEDLALFGIHNRTLDNLLRSLQAPEETVEYQTSVVNI